MPDSDRIRRRRALHLVRFTLGVGLGALVLDALNGQRNALSKAIDELGRVKLEWVALGAVVELLSYLGLGALQRNLLRAGAVKITMSYATALSFASSAIVASLPGGPAFAGIFIFGQYRRRGADGAVAIWVIVATVAFEAFALSLLTSAGVGMAIQEGASYDLIVVTAATLLLFAAIDALIWQRRWLVRIIQILFTWSHNHLGKPRRDVVVVMDELTSRLAAVRLGGRDLGLSLLFACGFWICDCAVLATSFAGVGASVPWRGLLLAYGAGQLAANLPITPGGLGVVEGSLTVALVSFGGAELSAVFAVLLYRIISFWGPMAVGWGSWSAIGLRQRYLRRHQPILEEVANS
ncbi:MAG TPA: YbhN family protein [Acidimicrobiales bacterium]|nr:YbhN family protein [Acidimicrobiales bacterium]